MNILKVKKLVPEAVMPIRAHETDAGWDLTAISDGEKGSEGYIQYRTGLAIQLPEGYDGFIFPRSSISKYDLILANGVGVVDQSYRGELLVRFRSLCRMDNESRNVRHYKKGDRIAQLLIRARPEFSLEEVEELSSTDRAGKGFGSSGS